MQLIKDEKLHRRLALYAMAGGGSALALSAHAAPTPIDTTAKVTVTADDGSDSALIDVDDDGTNDFSVSVSDQPGPPYQRFVSLQGQGGATVYSTAETNPNCSGNYAGNLAGGTQVGTSLTPYPFDSSTSYLYSMGSGCGFFPPDTSGFVGFQLSNNKFGFLEVSVTAGSTTLQILGGEYETQADTPITVRQSGPVPSPTPVPVAGAAVPAAIGVLALGAAAMRRRRRTHDA